LIFLEAGDGFHPTGSVPVGAEPPAKTLFCMATLPVLSTCPKCKKVVGIYGPRTDDLIQSRAVTLSDAAAFTIPLDGLPANRGALVNRGKPIPQS
jgi:hypothetical protein